MGVELCMSMSKYFINQSAASTARAIEKVNSRSRRQRRRGRREHSGSVSVEAVDRHGDAMPFDCFDLSAVGIYLHTDFLLCPGEEIQLRLRLPMRFRPLEIAGEVVRAETGEGGLQPGIGVAFRTISRTDQEELGRFLMRRFLGHV
jgi:PilZ domain